jgi:hypothetical protein
VSRAPVFFLVAAAGLFAGCDDDNSGSPTAPSTPAPSVTPAAPLPTPVAGPAPNAPVALKVKLTPSPPTGPAPLNVNANLCQSRPQPPVDDYPLTFRFDYGDGVLRTLTFCRNNHTYRDPGTFHASFCATDGLAGHESCKDFRVQVE